MSLEELPVYLDHNASTPILPEVFDAMLPFLQTHHGNPSSPHRYGVAMQNGVEHARQLVADLIHCRPEEIIFTSGGTESNNLGIRGSVAARPSRRGIITSTVEHPATEQPCSMLEHKGYRVDRIGVDSKGTVKLDEAARAVSQDTALMTIMHANSETGTTQPIRELARLAHEAGAVVHTDAAQSCGKIDIDVNNLGVDLLSIAGHKLYAPQGVGALFLRHDTALEPLLLGANHERGIRPGTENVASIAGLGKACEIAGLRMLEESVRQVLLRDRLWALIQQAIPGVELNGHPSQRLPNTLNIRFPDASGNQILAACPAVAAATGSACHSNGDTASAVIVAMGVCPEQALGSVRLTLGRSTTENQIDLAAEALIQAWRAAK